MSATPKRTETIQLRLAPAEKKAIQAAAKKAGLDVASYIRQRTIPKRKTS